MNLQKEFEEVKFLTSNVVKAKTLKEMGIGVANFDKDIPEIKSIDVQEIATHKANDTGLNNILVEDTAFELVGTDFYETQIKQLFKFIEFEDSLKGQPVVWKVALAWKINENIFVSQANLEGELFYPAVSKGYNFERILRIKHDGKDYMFPELPEEVLERIHPRVLAAQQLIDAVKNNDYSKLTKVDVKDIVWDGDYQPEDITDPKLFSLRKRKKLGM